MCKILLSINPEHVNNILLGTKQYEFRKVQIREDVSKIIIYSTAPVMQVVAEAKIDEIITGDILDVWRLTKTHAGISYKFYRRYYKGKKKAVAYKISEVVQYPEPRTLMDLGISHPPQSFRYVDTPIV